VARADYAVVIVELATSPNTVVLKLAGASAPGWTRAVEWAKLAYLTRLVQAAGVRVPDVLAVDTSLRCWPVRYLIRTYLPGTSWSTKRREIGGSTANAVWAELGDMVGALHQLTFDAFGSPNAAGLVVDGAALYPTALLHRAAEGIRNPRHLELFQSLVTTQHADLLDVGRPALTHEDLNPTNLLVERRDSGWHLLGLIELDSAWAGNPESDLARLELWRGMMHPSFWPAYVRRATVADSYARRRPLLQLLWCLEYARPTADHHAVTAGVCATVGIPPVRFD
jgi:Ser/Thr protein kinase RdoA (MazF antagonist)